MVSKNTENVAREAKRIYEERLRALLEESHMNEFVAIEPISGDHFLGPTLSEAIGASRLKYPDRGVARTAVFGCPCAAGIRGRRTTLVIPG